MNFNKVKSFFGKTEYLLVILFVFTFFFSDFFRTFLLKLFINTNIEFFYNINYFSVFILMCIIIKERKNIDKRIVIAIFLLVICDIINIGLGNTEIKYILFDSIFIFIPLLIIAIKVNKIEFDKCIPIILKMLNIFTIIILILGIIDYLTNRGVQFFLSDIGYFNKTYSLYLEKLNLGVITEQYRYISIFGHPLRNAQLFISFYLLNFLDNDKFNRLGHYIFYTFTMMLGVVFSNSKTAMVLGVIIAIGCFIISNKKVTWKFVVTMLLSLIVLFNTNLFKSTVLSRFNEAIEAKDLTSGRNVIFRFIMNGQVSPPKLMGYGEGFSNYIIKATNQNIASLEYPFMIFLFDKGIIFTLIFYLIILFPLIYMIKCKKYKYIFAYLIFNGYVNIYNGIAIHGDYLYQYIMINYIIVLMCKFKK